MSIKTEHFSTIQVEGKDGEEIFEFISGQLVHHPFIDETNNCCMDPKGNDIYATFEAFKGSQEWSVKKGEKALFFKDGKAFFHHSQVCASDPGFGYEEDRDEWFDETSGLDQSDFY